MASSTSAAALVDQIRAELAPIDRKLASHPFITRSPEARSHCVVGAVRR